MEVTKELEQVQAELAKLKTSQKEDEMRESQQKTQVVCLYDPSYAYFINQFIQLNSQLEELTSNARELTTQNEQLSAKVKLHIYLLIDCIL